jgi:hypothetical protein
MKAGQVYRTKFEIVTPARYTRSYVYIVVNDYGKFRPLILKTSNCYMEMNSIHARGIDIFGAKDMNGFCSGDELIADSLEDYLKSGQLAADLGIET